MTNYVNSPVRSIGKRITTTAVTPIYVVPATAYSQVLGIRCASIGATASTVTVEWFNSRDNLTYRLIFQGQIPANFAAYYALDGFAMNANDEIRVTAGGANTVDVVLTIAEIPGRSG